MSRRSKRKRRGHFERKQKAAPSIAERAAQLAHDSAALAAQAEDREKAEDAARAAAEPTEPQNPYVWAGFQRRTLVHRGDGHVVASIDGEGKLVAEPFVPQPAVTPAAILSPAVALLSRHQPNPPVVVR